MSLGAAVEGIDRDALRPLASEHIRWKTPEEGAIPEWTQAKCRFLKRPYYPCGLKSLKATLLVESPPAFRRRLIFVGADPLYRPRRDRRGIGL